MNKILAFLTACGAAMVPSASVVAQSDLDSFDFATTSASGWTLTARTSVNWNDVQYPTVAEVECEGENRNFVFHMNKSSDVTYLRVRFLYSIDKKGEAEETATGDHLWLYIDGERWEYANFPTHSARFSNFEYPAPDSNIEIVPIWSGYQAVRRAGDQPWIHFKLLYYRLVNAKRIEWSFKSRDWTVFDRQKVGDQLPKNWRTARYVVDDRGLQGAVTWCARQVASKDAYVLPAGMFQGTLRSGNGR